MGKNNQVRSIYTIFNKKNHKYYSVYDRFDVDFDKARLYKRKADAKQSLSSIVSSITSRMILKIVEHKLFER